MAIQVLIERGCSNRSIARQRGVDEKAVRYRRAHPAGGVRSDVLCKPGESDQGGRTQLNESPGFPGRFMRHDPSALLARGHPVAFHLSPGRLLVVAHSRR